MGSRVGIGLMIGGIIAFMGVASLTARADDDLRARMGAFVAAVGSRVDPGGSPRSPLFDEPVDGTAAERYAEAKRLLPGGNPAEDYGARRAAYAPVLAMLHEAANCRMLGPGFAVGERDMRAFQAIVEQELAACRAAGDPMGAVSCWLDGAAMAYDLGGASQLAIGWVRQVEDAWLAAFSAPALRLLARGLERLESRIAPIADGDAIAAREISRLLSGRRSPRSDGSLRASARAWRSGFEVVSELEAFDELLAAMPVVAAMAPTVAGRDRQWAAFARVFHSRTGTQAAAVARWMQEGERVAREAIARVRMLRLAVGFHLREPLPELADPFADAPLHVDVVGDSATIRCAGSFRDNPRVATRR